MKQPWMGNSAPMDLMSMGASRGGDATVEAGWDLGRGVHHRGRTKGSWGGQQTAMSFAPRGAAVS
jgi:hypothetical protein